MQAKLAIAGESYGGYATLAGVTFTPEMYCCAFDNVGTQRCSVLLSSNLKHQIDQSEGKSCHSRRTARSVGASSFGHMN